VWLQAADLIILPFAAPEAVEPPLTLLEAMACEAAVLVSPAANLSGLVRNWETGFTFESADQFADYLVAVTGSPERAATLRTRARQCVEAEHSLEALGGAINQVWARFTYSSGAESRR
jgi:glycosyltransferase involved in cell wall biosynthesis